MGSHQQALLMASGVAPPTDPNFASTVLLCHCDGTAGATSTPNTAFDHSLTPQTGGGSTVLSTTQSKFGGSSLRIVGPSGAFANNAGSSVWAFGTSPFTIEFWLRIDTIAVVNVLDMRVATANAPLATFYVNTGGTANYFVSNTTRVTSAGSIVIANQWQFWAYSKQNGSATGELSIDGTVVGSWTDTINYGNGSVWLGANSNFVPGFTGYMDEVRITKGVARYSGNFSAPTTPYPDS